MSSPPTKKTKSGGRPAVHFPDDIEKDKQHDADAEGPLELKPVTAEDDVSGLSATPTLKVHLGLLKQHHRYKFMIKCERVVDATGCPVAADVKVGDFNDDGQQELSLATGDIDVGLFRGTLKLSDQTIVLLTAKILQMNQGTPRLHPGVHVIEHLHDDDSSEREFPKPKGTEDGVGEDEENNGDV